MNKTTTYDDIVYISKSFDQTLPEKQASVLSLLGFDTPDVNNARVLEIGCSFGGNILAYALAHKNSECIGIDLSKVQIDNGNKIIDYLGVKNLKLIAMDVQDFDSSFGKFDYIICHGVFSWVPKNVQDAILRVIKENLNENGSAIISYNTYPGWKDIEVLRDLMLFRTKYLNVKENEKVSYGRGAIKFLNETPFMKEKAKRVEGILGKSDYYLYHEYFEEFNEPFYIYDFNKKLNEFGLAHVTDSVLSKSFPILEDKLEEILDLEANGDSIIKEQYYDYYNNTQFRVSVVTHSENKEKHTITRNFSISNIEKLNYRVDLSLEKDSVVIQKLKEAFPNTLTIKELIDSIENGDKIEICKEILKLIYSKDIEYFTNPIKITETDKPKLKDEYIKYFKYHLEEENPLISLSNFYGLLFELSKVEFVIALLFDGKNTATDIVNIIRENEKEGNFVIDENITDKNLEKLINNIKIMLQGHLFCN